MRNSYWLRSGFFTILEKVTALLFGFGGGVMLFRSLSKEDFGVWVLFLAVTSILEVGRIGLLQNALVKYLTTSQEKGETGKIITASLVLNVILTLMIIAFLLLGSSWVGRLLDAPMLTSLLRIYCLTTILLVPFFQGNYIQQANLDFRGIFFSNTVKGGILFLFIVFLFFSGRAFRLTDLAVCQVVAAGAASVISVYFTRPYTCFSREVDSRWIGRLLKFGVYVFGTNFCAQLFKNVDKLLLGALPMGGAAAVAIYDAAIRVTNLTDVPTASMASILYPQSARRYEEGKKAVKGLYEKAVGAILACMLPAITLVMIFAEWIILIVAGEGYTESAQVLRITILFGLLMPYVIQFGTVLDSTGRPHINFLFTLLSLGLTLLFNFFLIKWLGVFGAALGTLSAYVCTFIVMQVYLGRHFGINPLAPFRYIPAFYEEAYKEMVVRYLYKGPFRKKNRDRSKVYKKTIL